MQFSKKKEQNKAGKESPSIVNNQSMLPRPQRCNALCANARKSPRLHDTSSHKARTRAMSALNRQPITSPTRSLKSTHWDRGRFNLCNNSSARKFCKAVQNQARTRRTTRTKANGKQPRELVDKPATKRLSTVTWKGRLMGSKQALCCTLTLPTGFAASLRHAQRL